MTAEQLREIGPETADNSTEWENDYAESVREFLDATESWRGPAELPLAVQLRALARTLDTQMRTGGEVQSAAASQFAQTWARLAKRDPAGGPGGGGGDGLDPFLQPIPGLEAGLQHGSGCRCGDCP